jgi:tetraacyldisaccharide 4'-kinase
MADKTSTESLEKFLIGLVEKQGGDQGHGRRVNFLLGALRSLSKLYLGAVQLRLYLYEKRVLRHHTVGCQVISVGNLTVGGTGKTPVVEIFARELQSEGRRVAILSRGYRKVEPSKLQKFLSAVTGQVGREPPRVVSDGKRLLLDSSMSGDEPYMLASNLPDVCVLVDKDRVKSARYAISKLGCDTLILDDGFQYLRLRPRVQVVLVDATNPFSNGHVLPRGVLREPIRNLRRAHFIFITKSDGSGHQELRERIRTYNKRAEIVECRHCPRYLQNVFTESRESLEWLQGKRVAALSGIASPAGFERSLEGFGASIVSRHRFADHHRYSEQEILDVINTVDGGGVDAIVTTEKDAVRFPKVKRRDIPVYYLRVDIEMLSGARDFRECIDRICFRTPDEGAAPLPEESVA